jgi:hypothetical protein
MVKAPPLYRIYDSKLPRKERSQTVSSLRNIHGSVKSLSFENKERHQLKNNKPATSREPRSRQPRVNLPPAPSTSRSSQKQAKPKVDYDEEEDDGAASEPERIVARKDWSGRENATTNANKPKQPSPKKQPKKVNRRSLSNTNHLFRSP